MASDKIWLALYTKPFKEYQVRDLLSGQGIEVYLPEITVLQRSGRKKKPFFPHYLFARLDPASGQITDVRWTPGMRYIIRAGNRPVRVPDDVVEHIRRRLAKMGVVRPEDRFKEGDVVRIARGPLEGLEVVFDRRLSAEGRVRVFLQLVNRLVATEVDAGDLLPSN
ncbi:MAG: transcription termination/antitermination NusG family protein [Anaerolineae bacterium]|jgi:transcriptional antiterminator RfaH